MTVYNRDAVEYAARVLLSEDALEHPDVCWAVLESLAQAIAGPVIEGASKGFDVVRPCFLESTVKSALFDRMASPDAIPRFGPFTVLADERWRPGTE